LNDEVIKMANEKWLIDVNKAKSDFNLYFGGVSHAVIANKILDEQPTVDAIEVARIEEVKQAIMQTFDNLIAIHRDISNSPLANSAKYLDIPESSNDYNGIYADAMEVARRFVDATLTDLCDKNGRRE
jgi:hypothetical protein